MVSDMKLLAVERMGDEVQGIRMRGEPTKRPEPTHVRVIFPGGDVDIARCDDGSYWVHVRVDSDADVKGEAAPVAGRIVDARLDIRSKHASECNAGDFGHPDLYHLAVRVEQRNDPSTGESHPSPPPDTDLMEALKMALKGRR